eukprot:8098515-Prorocentrum_lima.AAC.1
MPRVPNQRHQKEREKGPTKQEEERQRILEGVVMAMQDQINGLTGVVNGLAQAFNRAGEPITQQQQA